MTLFSKIIRFKRPSPPGPPPGTGNEFSRLIIDNLPFIEKQCCKAVSHEWFDPSEAMLANEVDELLNEVLDRLRKDDYKALREYRHKSKLTTYISTIISNLLVDIIRSKKGRDRSLERAQVLGETAERLHDLVFVHGMPLSAAHEVLKESFGVTEGIERLDEMLTHMRGRSKVFVVADDCDTLLVTANEILTDEGVELVQHDPKPNAEEMLSSLQRRDLSQRVVQEQLDRLSGVDKLMFSYRFPLDEQKPKSMREIAILVGLTEKAVEGRIRVILVRFRENVMEKGLSLDDLINSRDQW